MFSPRDYTFDLPEELIAQKPSAKRDESRLLVLHRGTGTLSHHRFHNICDFLVPGDVLVINDTRVVPARIFGQKETGGRVEFLILDYAAALRQEGLGELTCDCLVKNGRPGQMVYFEGGMTAQIGEFRDGVFPVTFFYDGEFGRILDKIGRMPLPPYILREEADPKDQETYQTIYAAQKGAAAAPTAGLHFTPELLEKIRGMGITVAPITLHVGYGTFRPVKVEDIREHQMHTEEYFIPQATAEAVNRARAEGRRVIAVGTTCVRTLEYSARETGQVRPGEGKCDLFVYPGFQFNVVGTMITNFHLSGSTLMMLVSAFAGREKILAAYRTAVTEKYRFFSYGDAMMIV